MHTTLYLACPAAAKAAMAAFLSALFATAPVAGGPHQIGRADMLYASYYNDGKVHPLPPGCVEPDRYLGSVLTGWWHMPATGKPLHHATAVVQ